MLKKYNVMWSNIKLSRILHNPAYVKADADIYNFYKEKKCIIINEIEKFVGNKGCYLYGKRDRGSNKYRDFEELILSISMHEGVIDSQTWLKCQHKLEANRQIKNTGRGRHSWLSGLVKCGYCGYSMSVKTYKDRKYFNCTGRYITNLCIDKLATHYVENIEDYILEEMKSFTLKLDYKEILLESNEFNSETNKLKIDLLNIEGQIENLLDNLTSANAILIDYANKKILELDSRRKDILNNLNKKITKPLQFKVPDINNWEHLDSILKKDIVYKLISKVLIYNEKIEIVWKY